MKVLFLPDYSAANAYQRALASGLEALGVDVTADPTRARRLLPISEAIRTHGRPDVIHVHWTEPYVAAGGRISRIKAWRTLAELRLARLAGISVVWTAHDLFRHDHPVDPAERAFMRSLYGLSDAVVVHCRSAGEALAEELDIESGRRQRITVIPHGHYAGAYPDTLTRIEARESLGLPSDARVLAFVGWVRPYKGVSELIEAFARIEGASARLLVAGRALDDDYAARLRELASGDERVSLRLEFVPDEELQRYLRAADAVAAPFLEIFTSGSVLLAMSFGRAVIAPRRGCVTETLDEAGGILYDADDPRGLELALRTAMDADLAAMGRHNLEQLERFDWSHIAALTLDAYKEARASRR